MISRGVERFVYTYDYGDNWRHDVIVEEVRDGAPDREYPAFVDGARPYPPKEGDGRIVAGSGLSMIVQSEGGSCEDFDQP